MQRHGWKLDHKKIIHAIYFCGKTIKINNYLKNIKIFRLYSMQYLTYTGQTHHYITYGECDQEMCREETKISRIVMFCKQTCRYQRDYRQAATIILRESEGSIEWTLYLKQATKYPSF